MLDVFSRWVVGWAMSALLETTLVLDALNMAQWNRRRRLGRSITLIAVSTIQVWPTAAGARRPGRVFDGSAGDAYDNAIAEAFFAPLETELLDCHGFIDRGTAHRALFDYIEG